MGKRGSRALFWRFIWRLDWCIIKIRCLLYSAAYGQGLSRKVCLSAFDRMIREKRGTYFGNINRCWFNYGGNFSLCRHDLEGRADLGHEQPRRVFDYHLRYVFMFVYGISYGKHEEFSDPLKENTAPAGFAKAKRAGQTLY